SPASLVSPSALRSPSCGPPGYFDWLNSLADKGTAREPVTARRPRSAGEALACPRTPRCHGLRARAAGRGRRRSRTRACPRPGPPRRHRAVLDDDAPGGLYAHAPRRVQEQIRGRLAAGDLADAEDPAREALVEPGEPQSEANLLVRPTRRDAR